MLMIDKRQWVAEFIHCVLLSKIFDQWCAHPSLSEREQFSSVGACGMQHSLLEIGLNRVPNFAEYRVFEAVLPSTEYRY